MSHLRAIGLGLTLALGLCAGACAGAEPDDSEPDRVPDDPDPPPAAGGGGDSGEDDASAPIDAASQKPPTTPQLPAPNIASIFKGGCATESLKSELVPTNLLFVLDRSASMACNPPPITDSETCEADSSRANPSVPSKWEITRSALFAAIRELPAETVVGLSYFSNDDSCGVHQRPSVPLAALQRTHLSVVGASLDAVQPDGATPLVGATILAYKHLHEEALAGRITGARFVVLITDGEQSEACSEPPRCDDKNACTEMLVDDEVTKARGKGADIRTFVIGAPGSEPSRIVLSRIADHGGTAATACEADAGTCHFDMTQSADLADGLSKALAQIGGQALSCELPLPDRMSESFDPAFVNVVHSPSIVGKPRVVVKDDSTDCDEGANGWQYAPDGTHIRLCGDACAAARRDPGARIDVVLGCPVQGPE
jgi:hypothetical protein